MPPRRALGAALTPPTRTSVHIVWRTGLLSESAQHFLSSCVPEENLPMADNGPNSSLTGGRP